MDDYTQTRTIQFVAKGKTLNLRFKYTFTDEEFKIKLSYEDLAKAIRTTNSRNLRELHLDFGLETELENGAIYRIRFNIPDQILTATADELERIHGNWNATN